MNKTHKYLKLEEIGQGTYGVVYLGKKEDDMENENFQKFAIKKIRMGNLDDGVSVAALREIKMLQELKHENILHDVYLQNHTNIHLVYEFLENDLYKIIYDPNVFLSAADIKSYMKMLLQGINFCHKNWILHRDLKPGNLLLAVDGTLKIGDFGLAKMFGSPDRRYSPQSITRWYRPPEMLYGAELYSTSADMWSVGCIFAELMLRNPLFPGDDDIDQISRIFSALGTPNEEKWPGMKSLPNFIEFEDYPATPFKLIFTAASDDALDLLSKLLQFDPLKRLSAEDALKHAYFRNGPSPTPKEQLPKPKKEPLSVGDKRRNRPPTGETISTNFENINSSSGSERSSVRRKLNLE